jgi:hypothetical protein
MKLPWYVRRLASMAPAEVAGRLRDRVVQFGLRAAHERICPRPADRTRPAPAFPAPASDWEVTVDPAALVALTRAADEILDGRWTVFGSERSDMEPAPDWLLDPRTGSRASVGAWCWSIGATRTEQQGDVRYLWELSRHHHVTLLAAAYALSGDERYALGVDRQLRSWWIENPFLRGPNWNSSMELGMRLIAWVWIRRLLSGWSGVYDLFDANPVFRTQLYRHQYLLALLPSRGSSANNHRFAEAAGQFIACCAFPYFGKSADWRACAARALREEIRRQTFESGIHRELASGYHLLVLELAICAGLEGEASEHSLGSAYWQQTCAMMDALAASVDVSLRPPRQGDGDAATALRIDATEKNGCASLLNSGARLFGALPWWPKLASADVRTMLWAEMAPVLPQSVGRPDVRPDHFAEAGMTILRDAPGRARELWCRCDAGPLGFLSIAAHAHADALSIELRCGGIDVLADPGTYTYHAEPTWRRYFRSTLAHNTLEIAGCDQSVSGGPFLWTRHARSETSEGGRPCGDGITHWMASHDGYERLRPRATHQREVRLDRNRRSLQIDDHVACQGHLPVRLAFHLGPEVECELDRSVATLSWNDASGSCRAQFDLPDALSWQAIRGRTDPPLGWYSPEFGVRVPAWCLLGEGHVAGGTTLSSAIRLGPPQEAAPC